MSNKIIVQWLAVIVWAVIIYSFSAQKSLSTGWGIWDIGLRKSAHMIEFGILSLLVWRAIRQHGLPNSRALPVSFTIALLYAASDELHQHFVRGRNGTIRDVGFDLAGIVIAMTIASIAGKRPQESVTDQSQNKSSDR